MRVAIAEDEPLFLRGLKLLLEREGLNVVVTAGNGDELLKRIAVQPVDAAIVDIRMPPTNTDEGLIAAERIAASYPRVGILVLSIVADMGFADRLFENGSDYRGYLYKKSVTDPGILRDALERVCCGESVVDPVLIKKLINRKEQFHKSGIDTLTPRERLVLQLMAEGRSNKGIANQLDVSIKAIESNGARIFSKLGLAEEDSNRRVLATLAWLRGSGSTTPPEATEVAEPYITRAHGDPTIH